MVESLYNPEDAMAFLNIAPKAEPSEGLTALKDFTFKLHRSSCIPCKYPRRSHKMNYD